MYYIYSVIHLFVVFSAQILSHTFINGNACTQDTMRYSDNRMNTMNLKRIRMLCLCACDIIISALRIGLILEWLCLGIPFFIPWVNILVCYGDLDVSEFIILTEFEISEHTQAFTTRFYRLHENNSVEFSWTELAYPFLMRTKFMNERLWVAVTSVVFHKSVSDNLKDALEFTKANYQWMLHYDSNAPFINCCGSLWASQQSISIYTSIEFI